MKANQGAAGVDHVTVERYESDLEANLESLREALRKERYRPQAMRRVWIPEAGQQGEAAAGDPDGRDRVVQTALRMCWSRSSSGTSPNTAMASARTGMQGRAAAGG